MFGTGEAAMKAHLTLLTILGVTLAITTDASAQRSDRSTNRPSGLSSARDMQERSLRLDHLGDAINKAKPGDPELAMKQIREDFLRIQEINNLLLEAASKAPPLESEMIVKAAKEVNERARRLQSNLVLPDPPEQAGKDDDGGPSLDEVMKQIKFLDASITAFVSNPMFRTLQVINHEKAEEASSELRKIREASQTLRRHAAKLRRPGGRK